METLSKVAISSLKTQPKEKADMILEPLQVITQLALLAHYPQGTKISVHNNILTIQQPYYYQGIQRWWNNDNKDDLYYLFHAIRRYYKWYKNQNNDIYNYILVWAVKGIDKLITTYQKTDKKSIHHTLSLYKNVLDLEREQIFKDESDQTLTMDNVFKGITEIYDTKLLYVIYNILCLLEEETVASNKKDMADALTLFLTPVNKKIREWIQEKLSV